jgi:hypothetical protein
MNKELALHLLNEIDGLHERMEYMEKGWADRVGEFIGGGPKEMSQLNLMNHLAKYDKDSRATDEHTVRFALGGTLYTAKLDEGTGGVKVQSDGNKEIVFATLALLDTWLKGMKGVKSMSAVTRPPEGSKLLMYTQGVIQQQRGQGRGV